MTAGHLSYFIRSFAARQCSPVDSYPHVWILCTMSTLRYCIASVPECQFFPVDSYLCAVWGKKGHEDGKEASKGNWKEARTFFSTHTVRVINICKLFGRFRSEQRAQDRGNYLANTSIFLGEEQSEDSNAGDCNVKVFTCTHCTCMVREGAGRTQPYLRCAYVRACKCTLSFKMIQLS